MAPRHSGQRHSVERPGNTNWRGRLWKHNIQIKVGCFITKVNNVFNLKSSWPRLVGARRSIILILPLQLGFTGTTFDKWNGSGIVICHRLHTVIPNVVLWMSFWWPSFWRMSFRQLIFYWLSFYCDSFCLLTLFWASSVNVILPLNYTEHYSAACPSVSCHFATWHSNECHFD